MVSRKSPKHGAILGFLLLFLWSPNLSTKSGAPWAPKKHGSGSPGWRCGSATGAGPKNHVFFLFRFWKPWGGGLGMCWMVLYVYIYMYMYRHCFGVHTCSSGILHLGISTDTEYVVYICICCIYINVKTVSRSSSTYMHVLGVFAWCDSLCVGENGGPAQSSLWQQDGFHFEPAQWKEGFNDWLFKMPRPSSLGFKIPGYTDGRGIQVLLDSFPHNYHSLPTFSQVSFIEAAKVGEGWWWAFGDVMTTEPP